MNELQIDGKKVLATLVLFCRLVEL